MDGVVGELGTAMTPGNGHDSAPDWDAGNRLLQRVQEPGSEGGHVNGLMSERGVNTDEDWVAQIKAMGEYGVGLEKQHCTLLTQQEQEEAEYQRTKLQLEQKKEEGKRQQHVLMDKLDSVRVKLQLNNSKASRKNFLAKKEELSIEKTKAEEERNRLSKELEESEKRLVLLEEEQAEEKQSWEKELEELRKEMERVQKDAKDAETLALQDEITAVEKHREVTMARIDAWLKEVGQYLNVLKMDPSPPQRHLRQEWEKHESLVRNSRGQLQVTFQEVLQQLRQGNEVESKINVPTLPQTPMVDLIISQMQMRPPFLPYQMGPPPPNMANMGYMARQRPPFPHQPFPYQPYPHPLQPYPHPTQRYPYPNQPHPHPNQQPRHPNQPHPHLIQPHPHLNQPHPNQQPHPHPNQQPQHPNQPHPHPNQQPQHPNQPHPHQNQQPNQPRPNLPNPNQPQPNQAHSYQQQLQQQHLQFRPQMRVTPPPKLSSSPIQTPHPTTPSPTLPSTQTTTQTLHPAPTSTSSSSVAPPASAGKLDKLLEKLGGKFPQYTRAQLMSALQQIKSSRGTMAGLSMDEVIEQVGLKLADKPAPGPISRPTASVTAAVRGFSGPPQHPPGPIQRPTHPPQSLHNKPAYAPSPPPSPQQASTTSRKHCLVCQNQVEAESQHPLSCPHIVHRDCISVWLQAKPGQACPFCPCK